MSARFDFGVFQPELPLDTVLQAESLVRDLVRQKLPVQRMILSVHEAVAMDQITLIPGESYPDSVSVIRVHSDDADVMSLEPCCGTHVQNTADVQDFAIVGLKSAGVSSRSVRAVTRGSAIRAYLLADELGAQLSQLEGVFQKELASVSHCSDDFIERLMVNSLVLSLFNEMFIREIYFLSVASTF